MTTSESAQTNRPLGATGQLVDKRVSDIQGRLLSSKRRDPAAVAALARLRRGVGKPPGEVPDILEFTHSDRFVPASGYDEPTPAEWAVHVAMTLYATHQQSRPEWMHRRGHGLGGALRALHTGDPKSLPEPLLHRFRVLGTADSFAELTYHLRGAVQLLRGAGRALDYGLLADQLYIYQCYGPNSVRLAWGRGFYRTPQPATTD